MSFGPSSCYCDQVFDNTAVSNHESKNFLLLNFDCTYLMDCFAAFTTLIASGRIVPVEPNLNARAGNRPSTVAAAAGPSLGEAVGPERRPSGCRRSSGSQGESLRQSVQSRPGPNGSLSLISDHHDEYRNRVPGPPTHSPKSRTSWQWWPWPGGIHRLGPGPSRLRGSG